MSFEPFAAHAHSLLTLITRTASACATYPSCVAVYPHDSQSRHVLCRATHALHSVHTQILHHLPVVIAIFSSASRVKESFHIFARAKLVGRSPTRSSSYWSSMFNDNACGGCFLSPGAYPA